MHNEKPWAVPDDEWEAIEKQAMFQQCPSEVKKAIMAQNDINLSEEECDEIWQNLPDYFAHLRKEHKKKKYFTMFTPEGLNKVSACVNIVKQIANLIDEEININFIPVQTIGNMNKTVTQIINVVINEIKFGQDVVAGKCGNLLSQLNEIADTITLTVAINNEDISMHIYIKNAVLVKEI